jgi:hypothetical protein
MVARRQLVVDFFQLNVIDNRPGVRVPLQPLQQGWPCQCSAQNVAAGAGPVAGGVGLAGGAGSCSFLVPATPTSTSSHHRFNCFSTPTSRNAAHSATATLTQVKYIVWHIFMSNGFPIIYNTQPFVVLVSCRVQIFSGLTAALSFFSLHTFLMLQESGPSTPSCPPRALSFAESLSSPVS